ncbi:MAG: hypothetical protein IJI44_08635 [Erysipelotrichaceae bacterium]|nr:hypothetical protein [Erysipelotrichaceae bacterium]
MFAGNEIINREYKKSTAKIIIGAVLCALAALLLILGTARFETLKKNAIHLNDVIIRDTDKTGQIAYADIEGYMQFASYGEDLGYYIAWDEDLFYIISIKEKDYDYFADKFEGDAASYRFWGYTDKIPTEAKSYAISAFNEEIGEEYVNYDNFDEVFGDVYLKAEKESKVRGIGGFFEVSALYAIGTAFAAIIGLTLLLTGLQDKKSFESLKDSSGLDNNTILSQINSGGAKWYDKLRVYLTDDYLVSVRNGISAVRYSDIFWAYVTRHSTNGISDYNYLNIITKDGKKIICGNGNTFGKKHSEATTHDHDEILSAIQEKNESVRFGYDQENLKAFNELKKDLK